MDSVAVNMYQGHFEDDNASNNSLDSCVNGCPILFSTQILWAVYGSTLFVLGIPGNILVILVLQRRPFRGSISVFLIAVATMNILIIIISLPNFWLRYVIGFHIRYLSYKVCLLHRWTTSFCHSSISWLLVLITASRFYYFSSSARLSSELTERLACGIVVIVVISMMFMEYAFLHLRHISIARYVDGKLQRCFIDTATFASWARHSSVTFLPLAFLLIFTTLLAITFKTRTKTSLARKLSETTRRLQSHFTSMLILTDVQFIITNVPLSIYFSTGMVLFDESLPGSHEKKEIFESCLYAILFTGFVLNIVIYCFSASRFRNEMMAMLLSLYANKRIQVQ